MPSTLSDELAAQISRAGNVNNNPLANFSYKMAAYTADTAEAAAGQTDYDPARDNNIPTNTAAALDTNSSVLSEGYRSQSSSVTRNLINHFFGRTSFNLNKIISVVYNALSDIRGFIGQPGGVASLDAQGRIPYSQLPESAVEFKGFWNAATNTPALADGTGTNGDMYVVSAAGTQDLGSGPISFLVNDRVIYSGSTQTWGRLPAGTVSSVNGIQPVNGNVTLPAFTGASAGSAGASGIVPAPAAGDQSKFLCADGTWKNTASVVIDAAYPVGSLYWTSRAPSSGGDPNSLFPGTTWVRLKDAFSYAAGDGDTVDGPSASPHGSNTRTGADVPNHTHSLGGITGYTQPSFTGTTNQTTGNALGEHSHTYTPSGSVSGSCTVNSMSVSGSGTTGYESQGHYHTFSGSLNGTNVSGNVLNFTTVYGSAYPDIGASGPFSVSTLSGFDSVHRFYDFSAGSTNIRIGFSYTPSGTVSGATGILSADQQHYHGVTVTSTGGTNCGSGTIAGTLSGTAASTSATSLTHSHTFTASGSVSSHAHDLPAATGGNSAASSVDIRPAYLVKYCWERTA